ncbi:MAG: EAL domain-containing protein [Zoogloea sp.]|nr:EAL domain-containing protein [Zoogloea sp.]MCA0187738.1 EAL domain-containing protein [Pseudomonadota bacterium]
MDARPGRPTETLARILVIDDEPSLSRSISALLHAHDRLIETCGSVAEALARLNASAYDLLLLDYRLPDASGLAVMDWLVSHERRESVIMISAEHSTEIAIGALRRGARDFLLKPYTTDQLRHAVSKALAHRQVERSQRQERQHLESSERMHRYLVENSLDLIYTLDADGRFSYLNLRVESMLGRAREALIGQHFSAIIYPEDLERARFSFNERRTGARATSNLELRLNKSQALDGVAPDEPITITLNAMGMYHRDGGRYAGTYGAARCLPGSDLPLIPQHTNHDSLTRLPNRELFRDRLNLAIAQARRRKGFIAVMFIDMDHFRSVNDTYGESEGDALLRDVALRLRQCLRKGDTLTRHGSDEFLALLPDLGSREDAEVIAEKILEAFRQPFIVGGNEFAATVSLGLALHPDDGRSSDELIHHASVAMHQVKSTTRDAHRFFAADMHVSYHKRLSLEHEFRQALSRQELELHYQPLVSVSRNCITGMEALLRWRHPRHGLVAPARFIHLAEDAGIMHEISRWVIETGCAQLASWRQDHPDLRLSANLSARDFDHPELDLSISRALSCNGLPAGSLELEITERLLAESSERISLRMQGLRKLGVGIVIDDFGTSYSSLTHIQNCNITRLKIDRRFVQDIKPAGHHPVVSVLAGIARGFDIHLAAEGIEHREQLDALESLGCDEMQGFLFSRPVDATEATRILDEYRTPPTRPQLRSSALSSMI